MPPIIASFDGSTCSTQPNFSTPCCVSQAAQMSSGRLIQAQAHCSTCEVTSSSESVNRKYQTSTDACMIVK